MTEAHACVECASPVAADAPEGLCPSCLLGLAASNSPSPEGRTTPFPGTGFVPPTPAELAERFPGLEILELLGQGGMGAVYKARQPKLDRLVAVKILPPDWGKDRGFADRFEREAKALARLSHPNIVAVHDFGECDGLFYLVMEYVDGANLRQILREGRLQPQEALAIIPQVCDALQYAHEEGVVHRDIKPENILLDSKGRVKIADFGLAKLLNRPRAQFTLTGSQQVMGTLDYMAPEQRLRPLEVDHRADIYSLGVVFYEMLTGELPLGRFEPPSQKARVDARLDEVVFRALEREPERRYQRASQVKMDVQSIATPRLHGIPPQAIPLARPAPAGVSEDRFAVVGPAGGLILSGVIGCLFWMILGLALFATERHWDGRPRVGYLLMPLLGVPIGLFQIIGGHRLKRCTSYYWAMAAAMWAMFPWSPGWLIGLPSGIISLIVLRRPDVQSQFGPIRQRNQLIPPAMGIMLGGVIGGLFWLIMGMIGFLESMNNSYNPHAAFEALLFLLMPALGCPAACFQIVGGWRMMHARSYQFCVLTALWAVLPWSPAWIVSLGFAIWALRLLAKRDVQLAFGLPYQSHAGAFERPFVLSPVARPAPRPEARRQPEQARGGVRGFLGSMYSLMFQSRMEPQPGESSVDSRQSSSSSVVAAAFPEAIPVALAAEPAAMRPPSAVLKKQGHLGTGRMVLLIIGIFFAILLFLAFLYALARAKAPMARKSATPIELSEPSLLGQKHHDLETTLHLSRWGVGRDIDEVFRTTESEYVQLEARFTKLERDQGRVTVTIRPFPQEAKQLEERFWAKLDSLLRFTGVNMQDVHKQIPEGSLFPFGKEPVRIELWRTMDLYHGKVTRGEDAAKEPRVEEFSGAKLPAMYERFWIDPGYSGPNTLFKK
jgi:tRNA A-37 threonylcarbamoyl transferase component Bud32